MTMRPDDYADRPTTTTYTGGNVKRRSGAGTPNSMFKKGFFNLNIDRPNKVQSIFSGKTAGTMRPKINDQWDQIMGAKTPTFTLPEDRTGRYYDQAMAAASKRPAAAQYSTSGDASNYIAGIDKALGVQSPVDTRKAVKNAAMGTLNRQAHAQAVAQAARLQQMGATGSPLELALQNRMAADLAGQKSQAVADIEQDYAKARADYDQQRRQAALGTGQNMSAITQFNAGQRNAQTQNLASTAANIGQRVGQQDMERAAMDYEANQLFPFQVAQSNNIAYMQWLEQQKQNRINNLLAGIGAATDVGSAVAGSI